MPDVTAVLTAFRVELITAGLVRRPSQVATGVPPMHVEPLEGPPAPGEREGVENDPDLVLSLMHSGGLSPANNYDAAIDRTVILDVRYRSRTTDALRRAEALDAAIRNRLIRPETNYGYGLTLAAGTPAELWAQAAAVFGAFGPIGRSRAAGYDHVAKYAVSVTP